MNHTLTVSFSDETKKMFQRFLDAVEAASKGKAASPDADEGEDEETDEINVSKLKKGKKAQAVEEEDEETEEEESDDETEEDDSEDSEDDESEDEETLSEKDLGKLKLALKTYAEANGKAKAIKILHKYAKTSQEVKPSDLGKLLKSLKV